MATLQANIANPIRGNDPSNVDLASNILGRDLLILAGGGILGHPSGTRAGAMAMVQAAEAVEKNIPVEEYAKEHTELAEALRFWSKAYKSKIFIFTSSNKTK
ncbi:MAG: RuBisCO large subunit C-terminal-like domain-containing protein [Desulfurococcaceae archaeon]